jgi:hypothetical protein
MRFAMATLTIPLRCTPGPCPDTAYQTGIQLLQSAGKPGCIAEALHWIETAACQGHQAAQRLLGELAAPAAA